ncbi:hypothetical protein BC828DRAFT_394675 [Blastocladiella britannica]|nr:hypothetical protein BC828DRAFT_394675 [Blastocladiella britannica]
MATGIAPALTTVYRHALRVARKLPAEPARSARSLRAHVDGVLYTVKKRTFVLDSTPATTADSLWRQVQALDALVRNEAMTKYPLSAYMTQPAGSTTHYSDLATAAGTADAPSRRTPLQSALFKYFRFKA